MSGHLTREEKDLWKEQVINSRFSDFQELKEWLKTNKVGFEENMYGIDLHGSFFISNTLKVKFPNTRKQYQYNIEGIKARLIKDFNLKNN